MAFHTSLLVLAAVSPFTSLYFIWKQRTVAHDFLSVTGSYKKMLVEGTYVSLSTLREFYKRYRRQMLLRLFTVTALLILFTYLLNVASSTSDFFPAVIVFVSIYSYLMFLLHYSLKVDKDYFGISRLVLEL